MEMKRGNNQEIGWIMLGVGSLLGLAGGFAECKPLLVAGILVCFAGLVLQAYRFRCPNCGRGVATDRYGGGQRCPHCGGELDQP
ncbi:MAG: hypothetical protein VB096_05010 [Pseudoflavonifractor sp.]|nr:hypothetical protein [Pseudoflavonifractor sp.]